MEHIPEGSGRFQADPLLPGDQGVLKYIFRQLLDLRDFSVNFTQVFLRLVRALKSPVAQNIRVNLDGGQGGAKIMGHLGNHGLIGTV